MKLYEVKAFNAILQTGRMELTEQQRRIRAASLKHIRGDIYEIKNPVEFRRGEKFGWDGNPVTGFLRSVLTPVETEEKPVEPVVNRQVKSKGAK
jgi:hypothetical protein